MTLITNSPGQTRMLDVLRQALRSATHIDIAVSYVRCTGVALLHDQLDAFCARGGSARILATTSMHITQPEALDALNRLPNVACRVHASNLLQPGLAISEGLHAKVYVIDLEDGSSLCSVGSSNFSSGGLISNLESNIVASLSSHVTMTRRFFEELWTHPDVLSIGAIRSPYARAYLEASRARQSVAHTAGTLLPEPHRLLPHDPPRPNEAQQEALAMLAEQRARGERRAVVIAATGVGKTYLAAFDAAQCNARRVLFLSHRLEHLEQARESFGRVFGREATQGIYNASNKERGRDHVFATVQSAARALGKEDDFDYVVIDEFHHADARSYRALIDRLEPSFLLGLTATPERADGRDVLELCHYNVAYEVRLVEAIERGWLIPFHYHGISDETVDYTQIPWRRHGFDPEALEVAMMVDARVEHILHHALARGFDGKARMTVGFCAGVRHARFMADRFNALLCSPGQERVAVALTGEASIEQRRDVYARLQRPDDPLQWLFVADLLNEGVDLPALNSLLFLRPTQSATIFLQQLGRGLRRHPSCEVLTVLDFVGQHRHAWRVLEALHDPLSTRTRATNRALDITPPKHCEILLDDRTEEMLLRIKKHSRSVRERCDEAYISLREELGRRPVPLDLLGRDDLPLYPGKWRHATRPDWMSYQEAHGDVTSPLPQENAWRSFLAAIERDWQQQRVHAYALLWGLVEPDVHDGREGYEAFFARYPRWRVEHAPLEQTGAVRTLKKKLGVWFDEEGLTLDASLLEALTDEAAAREEVRGRLMYFIESDYALRHTGVLRTPSELVLHRRYTRPQIIHHFGEHYDPTRHNKGVMEFGTSGDEHTVIITKIDTSHAKHAHQYQNAFLDLSTMSWQSQNQQERSRGSGQRLIEHEARAITLHLFVQQHGHSAPVYCGAVRVMEATGDRPIHVKLQLEHSLSPLLAEDLGVLWPMRAI